MKVGLGGTYFAYQRTAVTSGATNGPDRRLVANHLDSTAQRLRRLDDVTSDALRALNDRMRAKYLPIPTFVGSPITLAPYLPYIEEQEYVPEQPEVLYQPYVAGSTAKLASTAEINTAAPTYDPDMVEWSGSSTSTPSISGTYSGADDDTFTFTVTATPLLGLTSYTVEARDRSNALVKTLQFSASAADTQTFAVADGLSVTIGPGTMIVGDSFSVDVWKTPTFQPDRPFDGTGVDRPFFDPGTTIADGSFDLNGETI
ncbi:MAG: hypothetical protein R2705_17990, partial [Ilumatobacteraceae bacterium]